MPAKVAHALGLTITHTYGYFYSMESKEVPLVGRIKYAQVDFATLPKKKVLATILVADIPPSYGMLLSMNFYKYVGGEILMDWSHALIPVNGKMKKLFPEKQYEFIVQKPDDPKVKILYEDMGHGNYMIMSLEEIQIPKGVLHDPNEVWILEFDGSCSLASSRAGVVLVPPEGKVHPFSFKLQFENTNNIVEYDTLIIGLNVVKEKGVKNLLACGDAELVVKQVRSLFQVKNKRLKHYKYQVWDYIEFFDAFSIEAVLREKNTRADSLDVSGSLMILHPNFSQDRFTIEMIHRPSVPNNA
ncbi:hypothetical protein KI387_020607, partial [Taxus chinensis]